MTKRKWYKGPPPHVGWWNASLMNDPRAWRWWNGRHWSTSAKANYSHYEAFRAANASYMGTAEIEWSDYYPANARVPRIDPSKGESK